MEHIDLSKNINTRSEKISEALSVSDDAIKRLNRIANEVIDKNITEEDYSLTEVIKAVYDIEELTESDKIFIAFNIGRFSGKNEL